MERFVNMSQNEPQTKELEVTPQTHPQTKKPSVRNMGVSTEDEDDYEDIMELEYGLESDEEAEEVQSDDGVFVDDGEHDANNAVKMKMSHGVIMA